MDKVRQAIVDTLKGKFPAMAESIIPFTGLLDEESEEQISYRAPGVLVCILPVAEVPEIIAPWELQADFGLVIAVKEPSAIERDKAGWKLCMQVVNVAYRNTWGISAQFIRPAIITGIAKNQRRNPDGTPTGIDYWTVTFYNWLKIEGTF